MWMMVAAMQAAVTPLPAGVENDLKCMTAISLAALASPADQQEGLSSGMMYFLGRIDQAVPTFDFVGQTARLIGQPDGEARLRAELPRCSTILDERGAALQQMGKPK